MMRKTLYIFVLLFTMVAQDAWAQSTAYVSTYDELSAAVSNASVINIIVTANIDVPCGTSGNAGNTDMTGASTAQLVINRSLTLQSQAGSTFVIKRVAANGANSSALKSLIAIRGNGNGTSGTDNLTENTVEVSFTNIIIDGGANWGSTSVQNRYSAAADACGYSGRATIDIYLGATLNLEDGVEVRNGFTTKSDNSLLNDASSSQCFGGAIRVDYHNNTGGGTINIKAGASIHDCTARGGYGGALGAYNYARLNLYGGTIDNCSAANGGAIACTYRSATGYGSTTAGSIRMYGGTISNCHANNGGAFLMHGESVDDYFLGGTITGCSATNGGVMYVGESKSSPNVHLVEKSSGWLTISSCSNTNATATESTGGYDNIYLNKGTISETPVYQVTFRNNDTDFAVLHVLQGNSLGEAFPAAPVNAGLRFLGWFNGNTQVTSSTAITDNITITAKWDFYGSGTSADPYQIPSTDAWNFLASQVNNGTTYSEKYFQMTNNVSVTTMVGASTTDGTYKYFNGTFDGNGKTLDVSISGTGDWTALFGALNDATIKNLHITGSITTDGVRAASIAGFISGNTTIENCWSEVAITSSKENNWVDAGAFVARVNGGHTLTLNGCLFTGSITYSDENAYEGGGMVGWSQNKTTLNFYDCVFAPSAISINKYKDQYTFAATYDSYTTKTIDNCYYNDVANSTSMIKEGRHWCTITAGTDVTISNLGETTATYNVSGITTYGAGIKYSGTYYAGGDEAVSLTLSHGDKADCTFSHYAVTGGGSLTTPTTNTPTLTMTDAGQVINVRWALTLNQTDDNSSVISTNNGVVYDITLGRTLNYGGWNTFCVPFNLSIPSGWTVRELGSSSYDEGTKALTLNFTNATSIEAGRPYLVKVDATVANPTFNDVTIINNTTTTETTYVNFVPVMNPTAVTGGDKTVLFVTAGDKLTYPSSNGNLNGFRAYFKLKGGAATEARSFAMSFDDETDEIKSLSNSPLKGESIYNLAGQRLQKMYRGINIVNGRKIVIK